MDRQKVSLGFYLGLVNRVKAIRVFVGQMCLRFQRVRVESVNRFRVSGFRPNWV